MAKEEHHSSLLKSLETCLDDLDLFVLDMGSRDLLATYRVGMGV